MSPTLWIIVLFIAMLPIMRNGRRKCAPGRSSFCSLIWIIALLGVCAFLYVKRNHIEITRLPTIQIPALPPLPRIATTRITPPTLRISPSALTINVPSTRPTTQFTHQWVEDWPEFQKTTHWRGFRAESSDTCVTEAEARQQAIDNAANTLALLAVADSSLQMDASQRDSVVQKLKAQLAPPLQAGTFIADQFDQKTEKEYGTLFKTYLLIDTSPPMSQPLNQAARDMLSQIKLGELTAWGSTAGLFIIIILLYAFLNAATKGYFVWKLRAVALMALIVAVLAFFAWGT